MTCQRCGRELEPDWRFCQACGAAVDVPRPDVEPASVRGQPTVSLVAEAPTEEIPAPARFGPDPSAPIVAETPTSSMPEQSGIVTTTFVQSAAPTRKMPVVTIVVAVVAAAGLVASELVFVSRNNVRATLASTRKDLSSVRAELDSVKKQLANANTEIATLNQQVTALTSDKASIQAQLTDAQSQIAALNAKVAACQEMIKISVDVFNAGFATDKQSAKFNSDVLKCYGRFPSFLGG